MSTTVIKRVEIDDISSRLFGMQPHFGSTSKLSGNCISQAALNIRIWP
jgi:hypothetical protein